MVSLALLYTRVSRRYACRLTDMRTILIIDLQSKVLVLSAFMNTLMLKHGVSYGQNITSTEVKQLDTIQVSGTAQETGRLCLPITPW